MNDYPISVTCKTCLGFCFDFESGGNRNSGGRGASVGAVLMAYHREIVIRAKSVHFFLLIR